MAQNDLFEWNAAITNIFPSGAGTVAVDASGTFTVNITWDDDQDGDASNNANFQTSFGL
jgi:type IV pilus assembly protein PilV